MTSPGGLGACALRRTLTLRIGATSFLLERNRALALRRRRVVIEIAAVATAIDHNFVVPRAARGHDCLCRYVLLLPVLFDQRAYQPVVRVRVCFTVTVTVDVTKAIGTVEIVAA